MEGEQNPGEADDAEADDVNAVRLDNSLAGLEPENSIVDEEGYSDLDKAPSLRLTEEHFRKRETFEKSPELTRNCGASSLSGTLPREGGVTSASGVPQETPTASRRSCLGLALFHGSTGGSPPSPAPRNRYGPPP